MTVEFILGEVSRTMALLICRVRNTDVPVLLHEQEKACFHGNEAPSRPITSSAQPFEIETGCES